MSRATLPKLLLQTRVGQANTPVLTDLAMNRRNRRALKYGALGKRNGARQKGGAK